MPCGCFGGGSKKKGQPKEPEGPPKPIKVVEEAPIKQEEVSKQNAAPLLSSQHGSDGVDSGQKIKANGNVTTPLSNSSTVDSFASTGARSRAELYAKRREFFKPLYDVTLSSTTPNSKFTTPRTSSTLPARGKKSGFVIGDETGYFTHEGKFVPADDKTLRESAELLSSDGETVEDTSLAENMFMNAENRGNSDRPPRPTSQPTVPAGQWSDVDSPKNEFHVKHHQILQTQHSPTVPQAPPPPKPVDPKYVEFQKTHHKILHDPESHQKDHTQKIVEKRLTELDKLHSEIQQNYEKRSKNGPIDVDTLVEQYTEDRWKNMVEKWESEGLVVEGGMVMVDEHGNVVQKELPPQTNGSVESRPETGDDDSSKGETKETVSERIEHDGDKTIKIIETKRETTYPDGRISVVKNTERITMEKVEIPLGTQQTGVVDETSKTAGNIVELKSEDFARQDNAPLELILDDLKTDENLQRVQQVLEMERTDDEMANGDAVGVDHPRPCTPPPSPKLGRQHSKSPEISEITTVTFSGDTNGSSREITSSSPPLEVTTTD